MSDTTSQQPPAFTWESGDAYERYIGRWSRLVAREFLAWLNVSAGSRWLDVGCGTGALSQTIVDVSDPVSVRGIDPSSGFLNVARQQVTDPRVTFEVGDARALPVADGAFDAVVSGLVLNFVPPAEQLVAATELRRAARPGGIVAVYVWDYSGMMQMTRHFWDAAIALDPAAIDLDQGRRFPICQPDPLAALFHNADLNEIEVRAIDVPTVFRDFDDLWSPYLGGQGPAPGYVMSLTEERRTALRDRLRSDLPIADDGSIHLIARAWALRGIAS
jgi:SAM-dependent methyltransferase